MGDRTVIDIDLLLRLAAGTDDGPVGALVKQGLLTVSLTPAGQAAVVEATCDPVQALLWFLEGRKEYLRQRFQTIEGMPGPWSMGDDVVVCDAVIMLVAKSTDSYLSRLPEAPPQVRGLASSMGAWVSEERGRLGRMSGSALRNWAGPVVAQWSHIVGDSEAELSSYGWIDETPFDRRYVSLLAACCSPDETIGLVKEPDAVCRSAVFVAETWWAVLMGLHNAPASCPRLDLAGSGTLQ